MKVTKMDINLLKHPEKNVRVHTKKQIQEMIRSLEMFGQIRPIVIDENNVIIAGNGLVMALKEIGRTNVDVLKLTNLTENQKKKIMIADNKIYDLGINDIDSLYEIIGELEYDLDIPGFDEEVLKAMIGDEEDTEELIMEYGKVTEDEQEEIKASEEKKEKMVEKFIDEKGIDVSQDDNGTYKMHVKCPKCGEIIWL